MNVVDIKGIVPGSGKTTTLINLFLKSDLKNKIILTPSNKARQECIRKLTEFGVDRLKAESNVKTMKKFKRNFFRYYTTKKHIDIETQDEVEVRAGVKYITKESTDHFGKVWNIFVDEASMFSDKEMKDLTSHWRIQNLILSGDSLQFDPIGKTEILEMDDDVSVWIDKGERYNLPINHQVLLNENLRSKDEQLKKVINYIKEGNLSAALAILDQNNTDLSKDGLSLKSDDWNIAYTNGKCASLNKMYKEPTRWIVTKNDTIHGFYTSEILEEGCAKLKDLEQEFFYESTKLTEKRDLYQEWRNNFLKPAYALTGHKLQGSTIENSRVLIHLDDITTAFQYIKDPTTRAHLFQKFLYVSVSRPTELKQLRTIGAMGISKKDEIYCINFHDKVQDASRYENDEYFEYFKEILENVKPMVDESIREDAVQFSAKDEKVIEYLLSVLDYSEPEETEDVKEWKKDVAKAHSKQHKQHKQHKSKLSEEYIELAKKLKETDWICTTGLSRSTYQKARRVLKERIATGESIGQIEQAKEQEVKEIEELKLSESEMAEIIHQFQVKFGFDEFLKLRDEVGSLKDQNDDMSAEDCTELLVKRMYIALKKSNCKGV